MWLIQFVERNAKGAFVCQWCVDGEPTTVRVSAIGMFGLVERVDDLGLARDAVQRARFLKLCDQCLARLGFASMFERKGGCA